MLFGECTSDLLWRILGTLGVHCRTLIEASCVSEPGSNGCSVVADAVLHDQICPHLACMHHAVPQQPAFTQAWFHFVKRR